MSIMDDVYGDTVCCPKCKSKKFFYVQEAQTLAHIKRIDFDDGYCDLTDVVKIEDGDSYKLHCHACGWTGQVEDYKQVKS
jgi:hypothetical protein